MSDARLSDILRAIGGDDDQRIENLTQRMEAIRREVLDEMANVMAAHHTVSHPRTFEDRIEIERAAYERGARELAAYYDASLAVKAGSIVERFLKEEKP